MIAYRAFPHEASARPDERGGALWFSRIWQGAGRHDNPDRYGCLYASEAAVSPLAEALAVFRGADALVPAMLIRSGWPLALATIELREPAEVVDLDDPSTLVRERLRPSQVATGVRNITQADALALFDRHRACAGLRWWSTLEASWPNLTLFDRAASRLRVADIRVLTVEDPVVLEAAEAVGLPQPRSGTS